MVTGENILQTFQFVATGNATLGIVAASQLVFDSSPIEIVCRWEIDVPKTDMVHQAGVILDRAENRDDAQLFMNFLRSEQARDLMTSQGYEAPAN
jgi:molybdate transport system substrate-binding protein